MPPWQGAETADIMYRDTKGDLACYLLCHGYFECYRRTGSKFYLEVKTTTKGCKTPFYMSKQQFARVGLQPSSFYLISPAILAQSTSGDMY